MNNKFKIYKLKKLKHQLKTTKVLFLFFLTNLNSKNQLKLSQKLHENNLKLYKVKNTLLRSILKKSIFLKFESIIKGPLCIIESKDEKKVNENFQSLLKLNQNALTLSIKLNKKIYSNYQIKTLSTLNYKNNMKVLSKTLKQLTKIPYNKLAEKYSK